ncbi:MAG: 2-oxoglutarate dehydrogenase, E2 component, dihydrolipoamide succinyltransferase, partial [Micrococcaceae bacterium]
DEVEEDDPILEVSTDKVDTEVPSPVSGKITKFLVDEDDEVEVGQALAIVGGGSGSTSSSDADDSNDENDDKSSSAAETAALAGAGVAAGGVATASATKSHDKDEDTPETEAGTYASPLVRKAAREKGIDLADVKGTGVGGRITREDVDNATGSDSAKSGHTGTTAATAGAGVAAGVAATSAGSKKSENTTSDAKVDSGKSSSSSTDYEVSPLRGTTVKADRTRQVVAKRMVESLDSSAQLTQVHEVDMTKIAKLRAAKKDEFLEREGTKITFLPFFAKAVVEALQQFPKVNGLLSADNKTITYPESENLSIAVDTERGLLVPVIKDAGDKSLAELAHAINEIAGKARDGKIGPKDLSGGTFTITNYGSVGAISDTPIINQPQSAILGLGAIVKRPTVVPGADGEDTIAIRSIVTLSLTYDHRLVDGADAGRFMYTVKKRLEEADFDI